MPAALRLLVSVRDIAEARLAADAGVDFIDLKDPADGALGALPVARIAEIVAALRARAGPRPAISATTGDLASTQVGEILARVQAVAAAGVDLVKVGIDGGPASAALLTALAGGGAAVVPVLIADAPIDLGLVRQALALRCFPALMLDTADKRGGSLLQRRPLAELAAFVAAVRAAPLQAGPVLAGLAGALRTEELPALHRLAPDFAGFRSAVCSQGRAAALDPARLAALCRAGRAAATAAMAG